MKRKDGYVKNLRILRRATKTARSNLERGRAEPEGLFICPECKVWDDGRHLWAQVFVALTYTQSNAIRTRR